MRNLLLSPLALVILTGLGAGLGTQAHASSDDTCYPDWRVMRNSLSGCSNLPFLSPGNDSRVNLRLLLADQRKTPLIPETLSESAMAEGYSAVPFAVDQLRLESQPAAVVNRLDNSSTAELRALLTPLGITRETERPAGDAFLWGEGSRCRSNADNSAIAFVRQVLAADIPAAERQALINARLNMLASCTGEGASVDVSIESATGKQLLGYLQAAGDFYSGRFDQAQNGFTALTESNLPWLKETALYMLARTALNVAQQNAFDEYGMVSLEQVDKPAVDRAGEGFAQYLKTYPQGLYAASATGLQRRIHWLNGAPEKLAEDFLWQLTEAKDTQRNVSADELVDELDAKLLSTAAPLSNPLLLALKDLTQMRERTPPLLTRETLDAQKSVFSQQPALYDYLQAAYDLYVDKQPDATLKRLPQDIPATLDYFAFSQQTLRALALEAKQDWQGAEKLWLQLIPLARQPLQREQLELALALNYEHSQQVAKVFAKDSTIQTRIVRDILLRNVADAPLLRQQVAQAKDPVERETAQFVLLYKDLTHHHFADFTQDVQAMPASTSANLGTSLGDGNSTTKSLKLFDWNGEAAQAGYRCPSITQVATTLKDDANNPRALNCLSEFVQRNDLDRLTWPSYAAAGSLGNSPSLFAGKHYSRLDNYQQVINNLKAPRDDRAYALFSAISCFRSSGNNRCSTDEIPQSVRKGWFNQLKKDFADTQWSQSLKYYW